jgi:D-amino-acid dehydrogenase
MRGADVHESADVSGILTQSGRISGVALGEGRRIEADAVVVCAGMATPALLKPLDITLPMQAAKGYHVDVSLPRAEVPRCVVIEDADVILTPMDDFVRVSGTVEISGDDSLRERRTSAMLRRGLAFAPGIEGREITSRWMGYRPCAPDGLPVIGPAPNVEGLFVATAHARLGLSLSPITGSIVADFVVGGSSGDWVDDLRVDRF